MGEILIRGRADAQLPPSHAVLHVTVHVREPHSQEDAVSHAAELCARVDRAVRTRREGDDPLVRVARTSSVRTGEEWDHGQGRQRRRVAWTATRSSELECSPDADGLTSLVADLVADGIRVSGPRWHVAHDAAGWDLVRTAAVTDARRRAAAYAAGVHARVGTVRWIAEPGLRNPPQPGAGPVGAATRAASFQAAGQEPGPAEEPLPIRIAVEPVAVEVTVEVAFDVG